MVMFPPKAAFHWMRRRFTRLWRTEFAVLQTLFIGAAKLRVILETTLGGINAHPEDSRQFAVRALNLAQVLD
jgi:hypothetical protein